ncbi:4-alpha-glucanotransferase [Alkalimonas collagenimarina]|uniref:4-alpha-glucanotransferase n=1 Tax=Alkalimonas collagenimarina TaxID=400390 RepID=A0ABT9H3M0_9GAMM|nr:4-alpha-glucanotransferase [Alkalimonas collagenimarina]MDP4537918.1 4-alpha-glucanotransferase [Alkalimonas collagenimarina]
MEPIQRLAELAGVQDSYINAHGKPEHIRQDVIEGVLVAMGFDVTSPERIADHIQQLQTQPWARYLQPVTVLQQQQPVQIRLQQPEVKAQSDWHWRIHTELGDVLEGQLNLSKADICQQTEVAGQLWLAFELVIPATLMTGYHQLSLTSGAIQLTQRLIVAPSRCYQLQDKAIFRKTAGPAIQLYALNTEHNWGIGDFGDLIRLAADFADAGCDFIGLNPLHALYPALPQDCSPYSPNSRLWLNSLYVDLTLEPEYQAEPVQAVVNSADFQRQLQQCRLAASVDYATVSRLKQRITGLMFQQFQQQELVVTTERAKAFQRFVKLGGDSLYQLVVYKVLQQQMFAKDWQMASWQQFPAEYQRPGSPAVQDFAAQHQDAIQQQLYAQWLAYRQLAAAQQACIQAGMAIGLYRDLAVGTNRSSAETWAEPENYYLNLSVGAPADIMAPKGQDWGLPPYNPTQLRDKGYQPLIDLLQANMQHAGALRIDHVMALMRLWCTPVGKSATEGAYLKFQAEELFAILALESQRNHCVVIGEDLGTVPAEISRLLEQYEVLSYRVFLLEQKDSSYQHSASTYPARSMATVSTHDMPTMVGYWQEHDLALRHQLDLYPSAEVAEQLHRLRLDEKQIMRQQLALPSDDFAELVRRSHLFVAGTPATLMAFQLEDLVLVDTPVNVPGTSTEYPNWQRRLPEPVEQSLQRSDVRQLLADIKAARGN